MHTLHNCTYIHAVKRATLDKIIRSQQTSVLNEYMATDKDMILRTDPSN